MTEKNISINITVSAIIKIVFILAIVFSLYLIKDIIMAVLLSVVIASGIEPAAAWMQKKRIPRTIAVVLIYFGAFVLVGTMFYFIIPTIFTELTSFIDNLPSYLEKPFSAGIVDKIFGNLPVFIRDALGNFIAKSSDYINNFSISFFDFATYAFGGIVSLITIIVLSFYLSVQKNGIENFLRIVIPARHEGYAIGLWMRWRRKIGYWLQGQMLLGLIVGVLVYLGLTLLRVDYALTFALLAAMFELIPIFGPVLSAIPPIAISLAKSPVLGLEVLIIYVIIQQFENHLIYPLVVRKIVGVPAIMVILALIIGAKVAGFLGVILAVPLAAVFIEILEDMDYKKKHSAKEITNEPV